MADRLWLARRPNSIANGCSQREARARQHCIEHCINRDSGSRLKPKTCPFLARPDGLSSRVTDGARTRDLRRYICALAARVSPSRLSATRIGKRQRGCCHHRLPFDRTNRPSERTCGRPRVRELDRRFVRLRRAAHGLRRTRDRLLTSAERKGSEKLTAYRALQNARSIDGLPGLEPASNGINRAGAGGSKFPSAPRLRQSPFQEATSTWPVLPSPS
jgi:hypothetical protein